MPRLTLSETKARLRAVGCKCRWDEDVLEVYMPGQTEDPHILEPVRNKRFSPKAVKSFELKATTGRPR